MNTKIRLTLKHAVALMLLLAMVSACSQKVTERIPLKDAFKDYFYVGTALNFGQIFGKDTAETKLIVSQFSSIVPENIMKWEVIQPKLDTFNFAPADSFVAFGQKHNMFIIGHCLVWHSQVPANVFTDKKGKNVSRDTLLKRMKYHINSVVSRYKGRVNGYDVVNEALNEDGTMRKSKWFEIIGDDFIEKAFEYAHEADSNVQLYYNDYNIENPAKRAGAIRIIKDLQSKGLKIDGVGIQAHWSIKGPSMGMIDSAINDFANLGVKVMLTELDMGVLPNPWDNNNANVSDTAAFKKEMNPYAAGLPDSIQQKLTQRYTDLFTVLTKNKGKISRVTFWGLHDGCSWLNNWPIRGRTNYPLIFDRQLKPKPAYDAIVNLVSKK
jgi:endo-1,4-beta-xylanase